ncbi:hypothetical protein PPL_02398 [Heterostelium album PN500]|uniref:EGF-like domain-containing protein n=1 Tax=Heterostelium pallidum (strain ATCC 26659 / Pp 5 / PN500) TaxID=670386 RepID=D3AZL6_HETP5|nr:hypothetical protein PPL_02398 [Heterostelium album PN500]EFA85395.1 hypothetical protein PPL_02398 [Heterostelium album PN500]|eukprot:XP_020437504.1 hypothetical protein PPL_02398 [Heterostelium album PN500]
MFLVVKSDLIASELSNLRWLIKQYGLIWNLNNTSCVEIINNPLYLQCGVNSDQKEFVKTIAIPQNSTTFQSVEPILALIFTNLESISIDSTYASDPVYNILFLLDQAENIKLNNIALLRNTITGHIDNFPSKLKNLTTLELSSNTFNSNVTESIFLPPMKSVKFVGNQVLGNMIKITQKFSTIQNLEIDLGDFGYINLMVTTEFLPNIITLYYTQNTPFEISVESQTLRRLTVKKGTVNMNSLPELIYIGYGSGVFPDESWFKPDFNLNIYDSLIGGGVKDLGAKSPRSIVLINNTRLSGYLYESNCYIFGFKIDSQLGVAQNNLSIYVPDCYYCYWDQYQKILPSNTPPPPVDFQCPIVYNQTLFYVNSLSPLYISGKNLGSRYYGSRVANVIPNKLIQYTPLTLQGKETIVLNSKTNLSFDIVWGIEPQIRRANATYINETFSEINIFGKFNPFSNFIISVLNDSFDTSSRRIPCIHVQVSDTKLVCDIAISKRPYYNITVSDTMTRLNIDTLVYVPPDINNCGANDACGGNGKCINAFCQCNNGYSGFYCDSKLQGGDVIVNPSPTAPEPTIIVEEKIQFKFNIIAIQEIDSDEKIVNEIFTEKWSSTSTTKDTLTTYNYNIMVGSTSTSINATIEQSTKDRVVEFGGYPTTYAAGSLKLTIKINNWSYKDKLNHLRVIMTTTIENTKDDCDSDTIADGQDINDINYLKVMMNDKTFYGRFLPYSVVDNGRVVKVNNQLINTTVFTGQSFIGISLPYCLECIIDPDFSVLVNTDRSGDSRCRSESRKWLIPTIIVVVVVGSISIIVLLAIVLKRKLKYMSINLKDKFGKKKNKGIELH